MGGLSPCTPGSGRVESTRGRVTALVMLWAIPAATLLAAHSKGQSYSRSTPSLLLSRRYLPRAREWSPQLPCTSHPHMKQRPRVLFLRQAPKALGGHQEATYGGREAVF